jgi:AcrR family transcriptional regulator
LGAKVSEQVIDLAEAVGKRERTKASNRAAILEAARQVFAELGYEATTVRDIIRRTDLASGTFYNYFKSKEELFHALHDDGVTRFRPLLRAARERSETFEDFLRLAYQAWFGFLLTDSPLAEIQIRRPERTRVRFETPESVALFDELKSDIADILRASDEKAIDPDFLTAACIGIAQEVGERLLSRPDRDPEEATRFAVAMVKGGMAAMRGASA